MNTKPQEPKPVKLAMRIKTRFVTWRYFFSGDIPLRYALWLMLPDSMRPRRNEIFVLFGKPFVVPDGEGMKEFLSLVSSLIIANQYHVELAKGNIIDAGANMGIFSILAAKKHPDAMIYAFEPAPKTFAVLKENTKYYPNIKVFNAGLGEKEGKMPFVIGPYSGENYIGAEGNISVDIRTVDSLDLEVNFIKIDTEGYEGNIISGGLETIKKVETRHCDVGIS